MAFFGKKDAQIAPERAVETTVTPDSEKTAAQPQNTCSESVIDPAVEARVVRKLDLRVPTLLGFLCTF